MQAEPSASSAFCEIKALDPHASHKGSTFVEVTQRVVEHATRYVDEATMVRDFLVVLRRCIFRTLERRSRARCDQWRAGRAHEARW